MADEARGRCGGSWGKLERASDCDESSSSPPLSLIPPPLKKRYEAAVAAGASAPSTAPIFGASDLESMTGRFDVVTCLDVMIHYPQVGWGGRPFSFEGGPLGLERGPSLPGGHLKRSALSFFPLSFFLL